MVSGVYTAFRGTPDTSIIRYLRHATFYGFVHYRSLRRRCLVIGRVKPGLLGLGCQLQGNFNIYHRVPGQKNLILLTLLINVATETGN